MALTNKQRVFLEEYLKCWNGAEAARRAGYAKPRSSASENLAKPDISEEIRARVADLTMGADEALIRLSDMARGTIEDFIQFDGAGSRVWRIDLQKAQESGKLHVLKKITYDNEGHPTIELYDAQKALELILKAHGAFKDTVEITGKDGQLIRFEAIQVGGIDIGEDI